MWAALLGLIPWLLKLFGVGVPTSDQQAASKQAEALGKAEQGKATDDKIIQDVAAANAARESVRDDPTSLHQSDGFRRD